MSILTKEDRGFIQGNLIDGLKMRRGEGQDQALATICENFFQDALDTIDALEAERDAYRRLARVTSPYIYELISRAEFIEWLEEHGWTCKGDATSREPDRMIKGNREIYMGRNGRIPAEAFMDAAEEAGTVSRCLAADILAKSFI